MQTMVLIFSHFYILPLMRLRTKIVTSMSDEAYSDFIQVLVRLLTRAQVKKLKETLNGSIQVT